MDGNASNDRADTSGTAGGGGAAGTTGGSGGAVAGSGGDTGGTGGSVAGSGGSSGTAGGSDAGAGTGGTVDGGPGASDGGNPDGAAPTCTDGIKNSDETGVDCGGHCGKCAPGNNCLVNADCTYACRADMTCAACNVAADCPGIESECEHRTCTAGACGNVHEAAGKVLAVQNTGDCRSRQCAANGTVNNANDDTDVPDDRNPCTNDVCTSGAPSHTMMPADSNCGGANHCNATGQCIGCTVAADCPGTDTACRTRTCSSSGVCGFNLTASGTKLIDPTAGDCKGLQCDGAGNSQVFNDNVDLPVDGNLCTTDECSSGTPSHRPVASGGACGGSLLCDGASHCVECLSASTCPGTDAECHTRSCMAGQCGISNTAAGTLVSAQTPRDCKKNVCNGQGAIATDNDDLDLPADGNACTQDVCSAGTPSNPFVTAGNSCGPATVCDGQGACVVCVTASTCPGTDTDCHRRTCIGGACGIANTTDGTAVPGQMSGDCKRTVCMAGAPMMINDDNDKPADGNACTDDVCTLGVPTNPNLTSGSNCGTNLMCNGQGACVGCITAADCGANTTCQTHTCTNGQCGVSNAAVGTALPSGAQTPGDCKKVQCDGAGQPQTVNDDNDKPVDTNACTQDLCTAGIPTHPPEPANTTCSQSNGSRCNGSGTAPACVQCLVPSDCPGGPDTECHARTCTAGVCGISNTTNGTALSGQTPADCKKNVCMNGNSVVVNDDGDVLVDGNECTMDLCTNGTRSNPPLAANATCNQDGGIRCNGSATAPACVQCISDGQCGPDTECLKHTCSGTGQCGPAPVANGTPVAGQTAKDCQKNVCNGAGAIVPAADPSDVPDDNNDCTFDICTNGTPTNPARDPRAPCNGGICNGIAPGAACVQCLLASDCGTNTTCRTFSCSAAGVCSHSDAVDGTPVSNTTPGDCHSEACMSGSITPVVDTTDVRMDGNPCTDDVCSTGGVASNPFVIPGTNCGGSQMCNATGSCVGCLADANCPPPPNGCQTAVCNAGVCGFTFAAVGTPVPMLTQTLGDCQIVVCNAQGTPVSQDDNNDKPPASGQCFQSLCTAGVPSNPLFAKGTSCTEIPNGKCDEAGVCVECLNASECEGGPDTECHSRTCTDGVCGISFAMLGTPVSAQMSHDCRTSVCDGFGDLTSEPNESDLPVNNNTECALAMCNGIVGFVTPLSPGTACNTQSGGFRCDSTAACVPMFMDVRIGDGSAALSSVATAVIVEERFESNGDVYREIALPTAAQTGTSPKPFTLSGVADSDGALALSADGHFVTLGGYSAAIGATGVAGSAATAVQRAAARINAAGAFDTATTFGTTTFTGNNIRSAVSNTGAEFWAGGNGGGSTRGVFYALLGGTTSQVIETTSNSTRVCVIAFGELYCDAANGSLGVFKVGSMLPTTMGAAIPPLTGTTVDSAASYYGIALLDVDAGGDVPDTLYLADERPTASGGGIQKWKNSGGTWSFKGTFNNGLSTIGVRGLAAHTSSAGVVLIASTAIVSPGSPATNPNSNAILKYVDPGISLPAEAAAIMPTTLQAATAGANRVYRGIAMSPR